MGWKFQEYVYIESHILILSSYRREIDSRIFEKLSPQSDEREKNFNRIRFRIFNNVAAVRWNLVSPVHAGAGRIKFTRQSFAFFLRVFGFTRMLA